MNTDNEFSKSDLFDLSAELSLNSSEIEDTTLGLSELDVRLQRLNKIFNLKSKINFEQFKEDLKSFRLSTNKNKRQKYEIKQLQHDLQLTRIELAQKDFNLNNLKLEYTTKSETLEEKVHELNHQNQVLNARLNHITAVSFKKSIKTWF